MVLRKWCLLLAPSSDTLIVLDSSIGRPATQVQVAVHKRTAEGSFSELALAETDADGRCSTLLSGHEVEAGVYRITFHVEEYFRRGGRECFYPSVEVSFIKKDSGHYHIPLLISPFSYTTYRGS